MKNLFLILTAIMFVFLFSCEKSTDAIQSSTIADYIHTKLAGTWEVNGGSESELWKFYHSTDIDSSLWEYYEYPDTDVPSEENRIYRKIDSIIIIARFDLNKNKWGNYTARLIKAIGGDTINITQGNFPYLYLNFITPKQWVATLVGNTDTYTLNGRLVE